MADPLSRASSGVGPVDDLAERRAELEGLRQRVMNVVGHALRTPMATLRGHVEVVAADPSLLSDGEFRDSLLRSAQRVEVLLDDLLVASGVETRLPVGRPEPLVLVDELHAVLAGLPDRADVDPELTLTGDVDAEVCITRDGLHWILQRLVRNALVYGGPRVEAEIRRGDESVVLRLHSPEAEAGDDEIAHAFELFYRGEAAVMTDAVGLGVGLPVARRLAEHAGGSLDLRRGPGGRGVTAVLEVPS